MQDGAGPQASRLASLQQLQVEQTAVDLLARQLTIGSMTLVQPMLTASRDAKGSLTLAQWAAAPPSGQAAAQPRSAVRPARPTATDAPAVAQAAPTPPWRIKLQDLTVSGGQL